MMSTNGEAIARSTRSVICDSVCSNPEWTDAMTMSERREAVVGQVERAVRPDVALDAGKQGDPLHARVDRPDRLGVREGAALVEPVGHGQRLAVVGDREVFETGGARRPRHRFDPRLTVGRGRVAVEVAP